MRKKPFIPFLVMISVLLVMLFVYCWLGFSHEELFLKWAKTPASALLSIPLKDGSNLLVSRTPLLRGESGWAYKAGATNETDVYYFYPMEVRIHGRFGAVLYVTEQVAKGSVRAYELNDPAHSVDDPGSEKVLPTDKPAQKL